MSKGFTERVFVVADGLSFINVGGVASEALNYGESFT